MRHWLWALWLAGAATAQLPLAPAGSEAEIVSQSMDIGFDGTKVELAAFWNVSSTADRIGLLLSLPAGSRTFVAQQGYLQQFRSLGNKVEWRRRYVFNSSLLLFRPHPHMAVPTEEYGSVLAADDRSRRQSAHYPALHTEDGSLDAALATHAMALSPVMRDWCLEQERAGRSLNLEVAEMKPGRGRARTVSFSASEQYDSPAGYLPFRQPQLATDPTAATTQRPFRLAILAPKRYQPTYPDGYPILPSLALQCAYRVSAGDLARLPSRRPPGPAYFSLYEANVPRTARVADLELRPVANPGPDIPPDRPLRRERLVSIPLDLIALAVVSFILVSSIVRRRSRGRSNSAT